MNEPIELYDRFSGEWYTQEPLTEREKELIDRKYGIDDAEEMPF